MNFDNIIGQRDIIHSLIKSIENNTVGHAYVFTGQKGIGKKTVANIFAGLLLCERKLGDKACNECQPCRMLEIGTNPDLFVIKPKDGSISVDNIRDMQGTIFIRPLYSDRKVCLIEDADKMTVQAQNCLLKILEEPPKYAVIILTASNYDALLETIRSRAVRYNFKKNTYEEIKGMLEARPGADLERIDFIAAYADGVVGRALELAESEEFVNLRDKTIDWALKINHTKLLDVFEAYHHFEENKDQIDAALDIMQLFYRDLLIIKKAGKEKMLINSDKKDMIFNNVDNFSIPKLVGNIEIIEKTRRNIKQNANFQLAIEVMLMKFQEE